MVKIRIVKAEDWRNLWPIIREVFRAGETYVYSPETSESEAYKIWISTSKATYIATDENDTALGTYYIKPNQPGLGAHVCNCGYIVSQSARGKGVASSMCEHSQREARAFGFRAMQYNLVVSTNTGAIRLWKKHGFETVGTLPEAFNHKRLGYVDALVMYKQL